MKKNKKFAIISLVLIGLIFATFVISLNMGSSSLTPMDIIKTLVGLGTKNQEIVIFRLRLPRILMALLIGIALAIAGTILQGVTKTYAIQAGRELRVIVGADKIDDKQTESLSTEIAKKIQDEMTYPGQVKITVIRETRAVSFAK